MKCLPKVPRLATRDQKLYKIYLYRTFKKTIWEEKMFPICSQNSLHFLLGKNHYLQIFSESKGVPQIWSTNVIVVIFAGYSCVYYMIQVHLENMDKYSLLPNPVPCLICCVKPNPQRHFNLEWDFKLKPQNQTLQILWALNKINL